MQSPFKSFIGTFIRDVSVIYILFSINVNFIESCQCNLRSFLMRIDVKITHFIIIIYDGIVLRFCYTFSLIVEKRIF